MENKQIDNSDVKLDGEASGYNLSRRIYIAENMYNSIKNKIVYYSNEDSLNEGFLEKKVYNKLCRLKEQKLTEKRQVITKCWILDLKNEPNPYIYCDENGDFINTEIVKIENDIAIIDDVFKIDMLKQELVDKEKQDNKHYTFKPLIMEDCLEFMGD